MKNNLFIKRPVFAISIALVIVLVGLVSLLTLPVEQYPDIAPPTVRVSTSYTGADAEAVQQSVIVPLEESINGVEDMIYMTSTATNTGAATISVYFKQGTDPDVAAVNVQNRVSKALGLLPAEVTRVGVTTEKRQNSNMQIISVMCTNGRYDETFIANWLDINLFPQIKRIEGVSNVQMNSETYSMRIWLKPDVMAQHRLTPDDISAVLNQQNIVASAGAFGENSSNTFQYAMKYKGRLREIAEFEDIVIRSERDGNILRLKDVAHVELGAQSYNLQTFVNGNPGVNFVINPMPGVNTTEVNNKIVELYEEVKKTMPEGIEICVYLNTNEFLFASMQGVVETLILAVILVILVIYFFLQDFKSTLIPSTAIVVSLMGTFAVMQAIGFSINLLTLFALVLAIGTVVDDSIVVVEAVQSKFDAGYKSPFEATADAMGEVTMAIISTSLVFMAVFIPVTFMGGTSGVFYTQFGITMAVAVVISSLSALTLVPALSAIILRPPVEGRSDKSFNARVRIAYNASFSALLGKYKRGLLFVIRHRWMAWSALAITLLLFGYFITTTRTGLVPQEDKGNLFISVGISPGSTIEKTAEVMERIEAIVVAQPEVDNYARIDGNGVMAGIGSCYGTFFIRLKDWSEREGSEHTGEAVIARFNREFAHIAEADIFVLQEGMIPGYGTGNAVEMYLQDRTGGDMESFFAASQQFLTALRQRPEVATAYSSFALNFPQYSVDVDAAKCMRAGITTDEVMRTLGSYYGGNYASNFNQFGKIYRVMLQAAPNYRLDEKSLSNVYVRVGEEMAPLSEFVTLRLVNGSEILSRFNLYSSISANVSPAAGYSNSQIMEAIGEVAAQTLPTGYSYEYGGISREEAQSSGSRSSVIYLLSIILIYFILASLYESFLVPLAVILAVPFGLMGSFLFARIFGLENNIYLQTGVIMLIGLLAKTSILIVQYALERRRGGMGIFEAAYSAAVARLRPILMTVLTMIFGLLPLILSSGAGAVGNKSLGTGAIGGMLIGTIALIFVVPIFFIAFQTLQERLKQHNEK